MGRYIDLKVLSDAKIGRVNQQLLQIGNSSGITISPIMDGVDIEPATGTVGVGLRNLRPDTSVKYAPDIVISGSNVTSVNSTYTPTSTTLTKTTTGSYLDLRWYNGSNTIVGSVSSGSVTWSIYSGDIRTGGPSGEPLYTTIPSISLDYSEPYPWNCRWSNVMGGLPYPVVTDLVLDGISKPKSHIVISGAGTSAVNGTYVPAASNNHTVVPATDTWSNGTYTLKRGTTTDGRQYAWVIVDSSNNVIYNTGATTLDSELNIPWYYTWQIGFTNGSSIITATGAEPAPTVSLQERFIPVALGWEYSNGPEWVQFDRGSSGISFTPITFTTADLDSGVLTIQHNKNNRYFIGLNYSIEPRGIEYTDANTVKLDFSDQASITNGIVWFPGSDPSMLVIPPVNIPT